VTSPPGPAPLSETVDTLLAFLTTSCVSCRPHWAALAHTQAELAEAASLVVVAPSRSMEDEPRARRMTPPGAYLHMGSETWFMYGVGQAGTLVLVRSHRHGPPPWSEPGQVLGSAALAGPDGLADLVRSWQRRAPTPA
jgi:hypothetical protein